MRCIWPKARQRSRCCGANGEVHGAPGNAFALSLGDEGANHRRRDMVEPGFAEVGDPASQVALLGFNGARTFGVGDLGVVCVIFLDVIGELRAAAQDLKFLGLASGLQAAQFGMRLGEGDGFDQPDAPGFTGAGAGVRKIEACVVVAISHPKSANWLLASVEDPLITCGSMREYRARRIGFAPHGGAALGVIAMHKPRVAQGQPSAVVTRVSI